MVINSLSSVSTCDTTAIGWQLAYQRALWLSDSIVVIITVFASQFIWFTFLG